MEKYLEAFFSMGVYAYVVIAIFILAAVFSFVSIKMNKNALTKWLAVHPNACLLYTSATMLVGEENFAVVYNVEKTFRMDGNIFLVGSFLVMKMEGQRMFPLSDRDLGRLFLILAGKMEEFRNGDEVFDALRIE